MRENYEFQTLLNTLLTLSLKDISLEDFLDEALNCIFEESIFSNLSGCCIFIVGKDPELLILKAHKNLSPSQQKSCARIPFGKCCCGEAAVLQKMIYCKKLCFVNKHTINYSNCCSIPLIYRNITLGILNLALNKGCEGDKRTEYFLTMIARHLTSIIHHKKIEEAQKATEEALRESEEKWRTLAENSSDYIMTLSLDGMIRFINRTVPDLNKEDVIGTPVFKYLPEKYSQAMKDCFDRVLKTGMTNQCDVEYHSSDGTVQIFETHVSPIINKSGDVNAFVMSSRDITERQQMKEAQKAAEKELERQRVLAMRADRLFSLGQMAAGIAHELNQPLGGVRNLAEHLLIGLKREWSFSDEKVCEKLSQIIKQADRMTHIINHIRLFSQKAGKHAVMPVHINDVVNSTIDMVQQQFTAHGFIITTHLRKDLPLVYANHFSLEEVIVNLLLNARDAIEENLKIDSDVSKSILVKTFLDKNDEIRPLKVQVIDQGIGICPEALSQVLEPFFTTKSLNKGTGLGLSICKSIIEEYGGTIEIYSDVGLGTQVTLSLPAQEI